MACSSFSNSVASVLLGGMLKAVLQHSTLGHGLVEASHCSVAAGTQVARKQWGVEAPAIIEATCSGCHRCAMICRAVARSVPESRRGEKADQSSHDVCQLGCGVWVFEQIGVMSTAS